MTFGPKERDLVKEKGAPRCSAPGITCALAACGASGIWLRFGLLDAEAFKMLGVRRFAVVQGLGEDAVGLGANLADLVVHGFDRFGGEERDAADAVEILDDFLEVGV